jgi:membrane-associated phospholipid phosphatase
MPKKLIREHRLFLGVFALYIIAGAVGFLFYIQGNEILFFDAHHTPFLDIVFVGLTHMVEGLVLTLIALFLLFVRLKYFVLYNIVLIAVGIVVQSLKHFVFADHLRPSLFFQGKYQLHFVEGLPIFTQYSFPSGHTALAFAVFFLLAIFAQRTWASMLFLLLAFGVGISRIYLLQHFWIDVYFGSLIGICITLVVYIGLQHSIIHTQNKTLNWSLYEQLIKKKN